MAVYRAKIQELLRLIPDLQCYKCKNVPGPNEKERNRYSCVDSSHTLCEKDKLRCPCGSLVGKNPSPLAAKLLEGLPWMCRNYKNGCREIKFDISCLEFHQRECDFRQIQCPDLACSKQPRIVELLFKDLTKHLNDFHVNGIKEIAMLGRNVWMAKLTDTYQNFENYGDSSLGWPPNKIITTDGAVFFLEALMTPTGFYYWANFLGSSDDAKNFAIEFHIGNKSAMSRRNARDESFNYTGPVHTLDEEKCNILEERGCFFINSNAVKRCLNNNQLKIKITITNIKEQNEGEQCLDSDDYEEKPTVKKRRRSEVTRVKLVKQVPSQIIK